MTCPFNENQINFICLASSSSGNSYVIQFPRTDENVSRDIMIECGLPLKDLQRRMFDYGLSLLDIKSCLITHEHKDHSMAAEDLMNKNIPVYANEDVLKGIKHELANIIQADEIFKTPQGIYVRPFSVVHDVNSLGFVLYDPISEQSIMFINDTKTFDTELIKDITPDYLFIECNHIRKQLEAMLNVAIEKGDESKVFKFTRQLRYHLSLAGTKKMLRALNKSKLKAIFLMHLSTELSNEYTLKREIETTMKIKTAVCGKNGGIK